MKLKYALFSLTLTALAGLWSCGGNDDEGPATNNVVLTASFDTEFPKVGDIITLTVDASSETENLTSCNILITAIDSAGTEQELLFQSPTVAGRIYGGSFEFTVPKILPRGAIITAKVDASDAILQKFETEALSEVSTLLNTRIVAEERCFHRYGSDIAGFNLKNGATIVPSGSSPDFTWDLIDNSQQDQPLSNSFISKNTGSGAVATEFVDLGDYDLTTLNSGLAKKEFRDRSSNTSVSNVKVETKILAKIRGEEDYSVVHVRAIKPEDNEINKGYYVLDIYRFRPR